MPNGINKNIVRLAICAAVYRARFKTWPSHARFEPRSSLWDLGQILDSENFAKLAGLMELRTQPSSISVGGLPGVQRYDDIKQELIQPGAVEEALVMNGCHTAGDIEGTRAALSRVLRRLSEVEPRQDP
jgi:hypothetical protein